MDDDRLFEKRLSGETTFSGRLLTVQRDTVELYGGKKATREVVRHPGGVCVAPVDRQNCVYMVEQFRYPMNERVLELPAGKLEQNEDPDAAIARELKEETGFTAAKLRRVAVSYPSPGFSDERLYLYIATGLVSGEQQPDEDEYLRVLRFPLEEAVKMVLDGKICDGKTQTLLLLAQSLLKEN